MQKLSPDNSLIQCVTIHTHVIEAHEKLVRAIFWFSDFSDSSANCSPPPSGGQITRKVILILIGVSE